MRSKMTEALGGWMGRAGLVAAGLLGPAVAAADVAKVQGSAPVTVVNDSSRAIPVSGEVTASVSGAVEVSSVPATLTDRIDLVLDRLEDIGEAAGAAGQSRANYARTLRYDVRSNGGGPTLPPAPCLPEETGPENQVLDRTVWASFIAISTENDDGFIHFCTDPALCCEASGAVLRFGHNDRQLPAVITATLPQAVPIRSIRFFCRNNVEDCEVAISIVGTVDP